MTETEKILYKNKLKDFCKSIIEQRVEAAKAAIANAQQSANSEQKSSVGDKYETARAMAHLEKDMNARQLAENLKELAFLHSVNTDLLYETVVAGSMVETKKAVFFIAAGLGKQEWEGKTILFLSPMAPLAKLIQGKKAGDAFLFNGSIAMISLVY